ncbi:hypothetical protein IJ531_05305 [bacterium]|nr:hypothetical protein [bacterium]
MEIFDNEREFNKKYPSKIYICSSCAQFTSNPDICIHCSAQGNTLFNYNYQIKGHKKRIIFEPIERLINDKRETE